MLTGFIFVCFCILTWLTNTCLGFKAEPYSFTKPELHKYREQVRELFYHGFDSYLKYGYPFDEVRPISCKPKKRKFDNPQDTITNDVLGNFTTTLVDSLTTLAVLGDKERFTESLELFRNTVPDSFDLDSTVQLFETTIRLLGGMMSAHIYATDPRTKVYLGKKKYDGFLLKRCIILADKLLMAYLSPTGLPVPRINLRYGTSIDPGLLDENNAAATASPMFEFRLLSMLTLNDTYRQVTEFAFNRTWDLRSDLNLLPMSFSPYDTMVFNDISGTGASIDSFYETALKGSILFDDPWLYNVWETSIHALDAYSKTDWFYSNVGTSHGKTVMLWIDSLSAFFPGLLTLDGRIENAAKKHMMFSKLWSTYGGIPERWNFDIGVSSAEGGVQSAGKTKSAMDKYAAIPSPLDLEWYPLRPEFIESTYYLYRATKDVYYLNVAVRILDDITNRFKAKCGFTGFQNVLTGEKQDRMESFVLGETLKYLYLIFDEENELHNKLWNHVFSTEAHPFWINDKLKNQYELHRRKTRGRLHVSEMYKFHLMKAAYTMMGSKGKKNSKSSSSSVIPELPLQLEGQCDFVGQMNTAFQESNILSRDDLFEIDFRYWPSLQQPKWNKGYVSLELTPQLYNLWKGRGKLGNQHKCALPKTRVFEGIISERTLRSRLINTHRLWGPSDSPAVYRFDSITGLRMRFYEQNLSIHTKRNDPLVYDVVNWKSCLPDTSNNVPPVMYTAIFIDGTELTDNDIVLVNRSALLTAQSVKYLSMNANHQLLINCIPVSNIYLE
ncbi:ER degradation-enhancing alpha-mannosidase-like protein 1 [Kluyveromyces marxianus]|nr:ER degradation-enhancing alpha-mannosidase-like protein 1 [Kluyveromyces marxianus]